MPFTQAIQRRDSYYWEDDSVEVTPVLVIQHNLHWIGAQIFSGTVSFDSLRAAYGANQPLVALLCSPFRW